LPCARRRVRNLSVEQEVVQQCGLGPVNEAPLTQRDERLQHVAPQDHDGLLPIGESDMRPGYVELACLTVVVLGHLVLDHDQQLAAVVDDRVEDLSAVRLDYDGVPAGQRLLRRQEHRHEVGGLVLLAGIAHRPRLRVESGHRELLQVTLRRDQPQPRRVRHGRVAHHHQQRPSELVLVLRLQPPERQEEVQRVVLQALKRPTDIAGVWLANRSPSGGATFAALLFKDAGWITCWSEAARCSSPSAIGLSATGNASPASRVAKGRTSDLASG
jgi:hypothetical protein